MTITGVSPLADKAFRLKYNRALFAKGVPAKACNTCFVVKSYDAFGSHAACVGGRRATCRACRAGDYVANRETVLSQMREHRAQNRERINARQRAHYAENCDAVKAKERINGAVRREANRARPLDIGDGHLPKRCTMATNSGCGRMLVRGDFNRLKSATDQRQPRCRPCQATHGARSHQNKRSDIVAAFDDEGHYGCVIGGHAFTPSNPMHLDHVWPLSRDGEDTVSNLAPMCAAHNTSKRAALPDDWFPDALAELGINYHQAMKNFNALRERG